MSGGARWPSLVTETELRVRWAVDLSRPISCVLPVGTDGGRAKYPCVVIPGRWGDSFLERVALGAGGCCMVSLWRFRGVSPDDKALSLEIDWRVGDGSSVYGSRALRSVLDRANTPN